MMLNLNYRPNGCIVHPFRFYDTHGSDDSVDRPLIETRPLIFSFTQALQPHVAAAFVLSSTGINFQFWHDWALLLANS
jgi:hypothetical protein